MCPDFKLFNPINERLINKLSFPCLKSYSFGYMDEERWPKAITPMSVLYTPGLEEVRMVFRKLTATISEGIVRWVREPETFQYKKDLDLRHLTVEY